MPRRKANTNVVYTGLVGAKMKPKPHRIASRAKPKLINFKLFGGPLDGEVVRLELGSGNHTLALAPLRGFPAGRYTNSKWAPEGEQA